MKQVDNPLSKVNIKKAQSDTYNLIKSLIGEGSAEVIKPIAYDLGGSLAGTAFEYVGDDTIMDAIDSYAIPILNQRIEDFVKSNSRLEKMRIWFNNKGTVY